MCFTVGTSWDENNKIKLETNSNNEGGVLPTDYIPKTIENINSWMKWCLKRES